jgi:hypothetical protein
MSALGGLPVHGDAMQGLATGNRTGKPAKREQQIYSPENLLEAVTLFGDGAIACDPCSGPDSIVRANNVYVGTRVQKHDSHGVPVFKKIKDVTAPEGFRLEPKMIWTGPGLTATWAFGGLVYVNPPYEELQAWLAKALREAAAGVEIIVLGPVRPHRKWWRKSWNKANARMWLDPLRFVGFTQTFPAPLCLWYFGPRAAWFKEVFEASELGELSP